MEKNCKNCDKVYESTDKRTMYCSDSCKTAAYNGRVKEKERLVVLEEQKKVFEESLKINPLYDEKNREILKMESNLSFANLSFRSTNNNIGKAESREENLGKWRTALALCGAMGGAIFAVIFIRPFFNMNVTKKEKKGVQFWQLLGIIITVGAALALSMFDTEQKKLTEALPENKKMLSRYKAEIESWRMKIKIAKEAIQRIPKILP